MTEASYTAIERIIRDTDKTTDKVEVHCSDLKNLFKELRARRRDAGILGYNNGRLVVNDIGIVPIIKDHFAQEFSAYKFDSIKVSRVANDLSWEVEGISGDFILTTKYRFTILESKYQIEFKLP